MNLSRFYAVVKARNIEFVRDKSSLTWSLVFPVLLLMVLSFVFTGDGKASYKVGVLDLPLVKSKFIDTKYIAFINYQNISKATEKLEQHSLDMVIDFSAKQYWVNKDAPRSYLVEKIFLSVEPSFQQQTKSGRRIRYVDWVLPGVLGMNMMFSCLFGVGYVIVRYRKNSVLKRLKATPLSALEFVSAQLVSRTLIVMLTSSIVYIGCNYFFDFYMLGSYFDLFVVGLLGAFSLITLGLLVACRSESEEFTGGLVNLTSWPMMMLSGVWFSLEDAPKGVQAFADILPLTHLVAGARKIITEGATLSDISDHIMAMALMSVIFLTLGSLLFNWNTER